MSAAHDVQALLARIGSPSKLRLAQHGPSGHETARDEASRPLVLSWPGLDEVLPDGGLPRGVVELATPRALGGSTSFSLAAVRAGQARAAEAWCAWVDPEASLYAPGVVAAGVDLTRLLIVCPPRAELGRSAVKVVGSGAFEVVVIDVDAIGLDPAKPASPASPASPARPSRVHKNDRRAYAPEVLVRKLALGAEQSGTTVLLLTDSTRPRAAQWPVALRLELERPSRAELSVRVAKDRCGRVGVAKRLPFRPLMSLSLAAG
jgi:recombination protein RecA